MPSFLLPLVQQENGGIVLSDRTIVIKPEDDTPTFIYPSLLKDADVKEGAEVADGIQDVKDTLESLKIIILLQRELPDLSADTEEKGTNALMSDYIREQEKLVWMYSALSKLIFSPRACLK